MPIPFFSNFKKNKPFSPEDKVVVSEESAPALPVDEKRIAKWNEILRSYKNSRSKIEGKILSNERFWRMRQWKDYSEDNGSQPVPATAWLFSCIQSKLSDVMDSYPAANFQPRQKDDVEEAKRLSSIVPIIVAQNNFEQVYRNTAEYTIKNGVGAFHIYWDGHKHGGLGDIAIEQINILDMFWEPGITDIQDSAYVFTVEYVDRNVLRQRYPDKAGSVKSKVITPRQFATDEQIRNSDKVVVVDVYYHIESEGRRILHRCKYADTVCLESTENSPDIFPNGLYDHGLYPFVVQNLYHIEQSLYGIGMVDIGADTQIQIDLMNEAVVENTLMGAKPRYMTSLDGNINEDELADWTKNIVHCSSVSDTTTKLIESKPLQGNYLEFIIKKIEELKYITSNQDVNNGVAPSGITAASAIAALQETSGKNSRSINKTFYNSFRLIMEQVVELIRQFYDTARQFRIIPDQTRGEVQFIQYDNSRLKNQEQFSASGQSLGFRKPEFDIEVTAEKANPYKKMEMNELALSFFKMGFFNPQLADQALACLNMMDFDKREQIIEQIQTNRTLLDQVMMYQQLSIALARKYGDTEAMQAIEMSLMQNGQQMPPSGDVSPSEAANPGQNTGEIKQVENARSRARNSTEVD